MNFLAPLNKKQLLRTKSGMLKRIMLHVSEFKQSGYSLIENNMAFGLSVGSSYTGMRYI